MPLYNAAPFFEGSVTSVLNQTYKNWELIIVDDCSTDESREQALKFSKLDARVLYFRNAVNCGVAASRNVALDNASGRFVAFLDSDDQWEEDKLERQVDFAVRNSSIITYCVYRRIAESGKALGVVQPKARVFYKDMLFRNHIGNLTAMYDKFKLPTLRFKKVGHEDYIFWVEAIAQAGSAELVPSDVPLAKYLVRSASLSGNKIKAAKWQWDNYRKNLGFGFIHSVFYFVCYAASSVFRKL
ncbi:glycosyltransferase [Pseudomonas putida]|uniref:glycosyltransferase family 2 protein n=1 Tax=Pseudomonas putida TaxID=303 RepID=UPI0018AAFDBD|nr:glycosyltransferase [Pseudomonas putida]MBF8711010.1 glycosyltransferase [Pseudomonas putida]